jgi:hypothetical protein
MPKQPTQKQIKAAELVSENIRKDKPEPIGAVLKQAGYSDSVAESPQRVTDTIGFQALIDQYLPEEDLAKAHREVLNTKKIEHMVFPLNMTDEDITELVESVNGVVRKFQHSETATHVWFWAADGKLKLDAVKLAYNLRGKATGDDKPTGDTYNTYIQQNNVNPNAPDSKDLVADTLELLMSKMKQE